MKRSKVLLASSILSSVYFILLLGTFGVVFREVEGTDYIAVLNAYFELAFALVGMHAPAVTALYVMLVLFCAHITVAVLGVIIGWIAFAGKKSGLAKFVAVLYLIETLCFPICLPFGLPMTILGFVGSGNQKKMNKTAATN